MRDVAKAADLYRADLFRNAAQRLGLKEAIVEKDFWVCYLLDFLFHRSQWHRSFIFKGGTSISKAYGLISRFSEDIDLILDWRVLGYGRDEPWQPRSNTKQDAFNKEANARAGRFPEDEFVPATRMVLSEDLGVEADLHIDPHDNQVVLFAFPRLFATISTLQEIKLEIGALAAWTPSAPALIRPYAAECYPKVFKTPATLISTSSAERTFWEKATILHHEANRPEDLAMPKRYSRHYYDLYCMANSDVRERALSDARLLQEVVGFKMKFYPRGWARYQDAVPGTLRLVPPDHRIDSLKADYSSMTEMIFGPVPGFDEILDGLAGLEAEINKGTLS